MKHDLHMEFYYPLPPEKVWTALTDSDELAQWLMPNDHKPVEGRKFQFRAQPQPYWDGIVDCEVVKVDPPKQLVWKWEGGSTKENKHFTTVTWTLIPTDEGTRLILDHTGFEGTDGASLSQMLGSGWKKMLSSQEFLEQVSRL